MKPHNELTPAQAERLAILAEECGEVIQIIGKILRHGYDSSHPINLGGPTNRQALEKELGDVRWAAKFMCSQGDIKEASIKYNSNVKTDKVQPYLHHQEEK